MTSPYSLQQLEQIQEMKRQHQMIMGDLMNSNSMNSPVLLQGTMMMPSQLAHNMVNLKPMDIASPPIVVLESEDEEDDEEQRTLFVANLDERVTEEILYEIFVQTGPIDRVRIPKDGGGRQRTFGFITFTHRCSPPYAMHLLQGLSLYRKTLTIKFNGKNFPPPMKSPILSIRSNNEKTYDNSSLRCGGNYSSYIDNKRMNMDKTPSRHQDRLPKHASNQMRPHSNSSPYHQQQQQRRDSPNPFSDKRRYHNNHKNNGNNGNNNRYSDQRGNSGGGGGGSGGGGKYRR